MVLASYASPTPGAKETTLFSPTTSRRRTLTIPPDFSHAKPGDYMALPSHVMVLASITPRQPPGAKETTLFSPTTSRRRTLTIPPDFSHEKPGDYMALPSHVMVLASITPRQPPGAKETYNHQSSLSTFRLHNSVFSHNVHEKTQYSVVEYRNRQRRT